MGNGLLVRTPWLGIFLAVILSTCSPSPDKNSHHASSQSGSGASASEGPTVDGAWTSGVIKDQFTDKDVLVASGDTEVDDGHNGKVHTEIKYADGALGITMELTYVNDEQDKSNSCDYLSIARTGSFAGFSANIESRNERNPIPAREDTSGTQNCNAVTLIYADEPEFATYYCSDCATTVLSSADFRVKLPLANGISPVIFLNFKDNRALREFAEYALAGINQAKQRDAAEVQKQEQPSSPQSTPPQDSQASTESSDGNDQGDNNSSAPTQPEENYGDTGGEAPMNAVSAKEQMDAEVAVVKNFYEALSRDDGTAAASYVIPEKRDKGPLSADEMTTYYSDVKSPVHIDDIHEQQGLGVAVQYSYVTRDNKPCKVSTFVTMDYRNGSQSPLIGKIKLVSARCS